MKLCAFERREKHARAHLKLTPFSASYYFLKAFNVRNYASAQIARPSTPKLHNVPVRLWRVFVSFLTHVTQGVRLKKAEPCLRNSTKRID